jgi:Putative DNA-binding HTH domain
MVQPDAVIRDVHYITPLYRKAEAARIIAVPTTTFRNWAVGYAYKRLDGPEVVSQPIVTTARPAVLWLQQHIGLIRHWPVNGLRPMARRCSGTTGTNPKTKRTGRWWKAWWSSAAGSSVPSSGQQLPPASHV